MPRHVKLATFIDRVFEFLKTIPKGRVVTYGIVARHCHVPSARNVGWILKQNTDPDKIPCYKVVRSDGRLAKGYKFGGPEEQKKRLIAEGIKFDSLYDIIAGHPFYSGFHRRQANFGRGCKTYSKDNRRRPKGR